MKTNFKISFVIPFCILLGCTDTDISEVQSARAVVEAIMVADEPISIHVSKEILFKRDSSDNDFDLEGLTVTISDGSEQFTLTDEGNGKYTANNLIDFNRTYTMEFMYDGKLITAETAVPLRPDDFTSSASALVIAQSSGYGPPTGSTVTLDLKWSNTDGSTYLVVVGNIETDPEPISTSGTTRPVFRSEPIATDNYQIRGAQFQYYGMHEIILFKIGADYAALYEDPGDNSLNIKSPYTNVTNGLGIFTAVNADTLYVNVTK